MTLPESLYLHLRDDSALRLLIDKRVYPIILPQVDDPKAIDQFLPAVTYQQIAESPEYTLDKRSVRLPLMQVSSWSRSLHVAQQVADAVYAALNGFQGQMSAGGVTVLHCLLNDRGPEIYEPETEIFQVVQEFDFFYRA